MGVVFECVHDDIAQQGDLSSTMSSAEIAAARSQQQGGLGSEIVLGDGTSTTPNTRLDARPPNASACEAQMRRVTRLHAAFPSASAPLQKACAAEFRSLCGAGGAALDSGPLEDRKVLACIRKNEARLSDHCRAKATAIERIAHRELAHNAEVGAACAIELQSHCAATLHREASEASQKPTTGRFAKAPARAPAQAEETSGACLDRHSRTQGARKFGDTCSKVLLEYQLRATESLDLLEEVRRPCAVDYANLCAAASAQSHPGAAMQCLKDNRDLLQEEKCHEAVLGAMARAAADARYDPLLAQKCAAEMVTCAAEGIVSGGGRVHACLRRKAREHGLSAACQQQVFKAQQAEPRGRTLTPTPTLTLTLTLALTLALTLTLSRPSSRTCGSTTLYSRHARSSSCASARRYRRGRRGGSRASRRMRRRRTLARAAPSCYAAHCATRCATSGVPRKAYCLNPKANAKTPSPTPTPTPTPTPSPTPSLPYPGARLPAAAASREGVR